MATNHGTEHIGHRAAENALHAVRYAKSLGRTINTMITISFIALGVADEEAGAMFKRLNGSLARWWRYQRWGKGRDIGPLTAIYAHANPSGSRHVHWLMHLPEGLHDEFEAAITKRLCKIAKVDDLGDALHIQGVGGPGGAAKYILRGIDPAYGSYMHIRPEDEGTVSCRRTGTTRAIGRSARRHSGWKRKAPAHDATVTSNAAVAPTHAVVDTPRCNLMANHVSQ